MSQRFTRTTRMSLIVGTFVAALIDCIILITSLELGRSIKAMTLADNQKVAAARAFQLGEMMDKLYWQLIIAFLSKLENLFAVSGSIRAGESEPRATGIAPPADQQGLVS